MLKDLNKQIKMFIYYSNTHARCVNCIYCHIHLPHVYKATCCSNIYFSTLHHCTMAILSTFVNVVFYTVYRYFLCTFISAHSSLCLPWQACCPCFKLYVCLFLCLYIERNEKAESNSLYAYTYMANKAMLFFMFLFIFCCCQWLNI